MGGELPHLEACIATYLDLWERFGDDRFSGGEVVLDGEERADETGIPASDRRFDLLVAYGLLDHIEGDDYRVRCSPDDTRIEWRDRFVDRADRLHGMVDARFDAESSDDSDERLLTHRGRSYVSVFVDDRTTVGEIAERASRLDERGELHAGLVLRCPADEADEAQAVADRLIDESQLSFEKVTSEVTGVDSDALQFRLYVAPASGD